MGSLEMTQGGQFHVILASTPSMGIGRDGAIPWRLPGEVRHFQRATLAKATTPEGKQNAVIMGRKTWESLPDKHRPLKNRVNIVMSRRDNLELPDGVLRARDFDGALAAADSDARVHEAFVIGGARVYEEALAHPRCGRILHTVILSDIECSVFAPRIPQSRFSVVSRGAVQEEEGLSYSLVTYHRRPHEEQQYLDLIHEIITTGNERGDRTGVGTISLFGRQMRFNLRESFPLLTTKRVFWRGVVEELLWLVRGSTSANDLAKRKVHIWDANATREFLDNRGLHQYEEGDLGPVYGFQWRHFGASYTSMNADYTGQGVDQLAAVIESIRSNPCDRRIIMSAWNPSDLPKMALPPCHILAQFYVHDGELSCQLYQRSADMGLGVPFNIASYALLTYMIAHICDLRPGDFVHCLGDAHVYSNHVGPLLEQLKREPRPFPRLSFRRNVAAVTDFTFDDLELTGYDPHPTIKMEMAV